MRIPAGITLIVLGAILTFALKGGHIGNLDLHAVGVILMLAGIIGMLLPTLIRNRPRLSRTTARSRHDITDDETRTVVNHADGSQTLVEHDDGAQTFAQHFDAGPAPAGPSPAGPSPAGPAPASPSPASPSPASPSPASPSPASPSLNGGRRNHGPRRR